MEAESTHPACATGRHHAGIGKPRPTSVRCPARIYPPVARGRPRISEAEHFPPREGAPGPAAARRGIAERWALSDLLPPPPWGLGFLAKLPTSDLMDGLITLPRGALRRASRVSAQSHRPRPRRTWMGAAVGQGSGSQSGGDLNSPESGPVTRHIFAGSEAGEQRSPGRAGPRRLRPPASAPSCPATSGAAQTPAGAPESQLRKPGTRLERPLRPTHTEVASRPPHSRPRGSHSHSPRVP